jgi:hypothetical protein
MANNAIVANQYGCPSALNDISKIATTFSNNSTESCKFAIESISSVHNANVENLSDSSLTQEQHEHIDKTTTSAFNDITKVFLIEKTADIIKTLIWAKAVVTICTKICVRNK